MAVVIETGARFPLDPDRKHEPTLMTRDEAGRQLRLEFYSRAARIGAELGAAVVSFWSGVDRGGPADTETTLRAGVEAACERIRAEGLIPALEPEPGMAVSTVADYLLLSEQLGTAAPSLCLDVGPSGWLHSPSTTFAENTFSQCSGLLKLYRTLSCKIGARIIL